jgi:hypothetical protein
MRRRVTSRRSRGGASASPSARTSWGRGRTRPASTLRAWSQREDPSSSSPPIPVRNEPPRASANSGVWKWAFEGQRSPWRARLAEATGPTQSSSSVSSSRIQSLSPRWATTLSCHSLSAESSAAGKRSVAGIGSARPSRRATDAATARTAEESRPPEKLTRQGPCRSGSTSARSIAARGSESRAGTSMFATVPRTRPEATSSGLSVLTGGARAAARRGGAPGRPVQAHRLRRPPTRAP